MYIKSSLYTCHKGSYNELNFAKEVNKTMSELYTYPLRQSIGAPSSPLVKNGDKVRRGQRIAEAGAGLGVPIYTSVNGTVQGVTDTEITVSYEETDFSTYLPLPDALTDPLTIMKEAGLVGLGGAGFPTYAKLSKPFETGGTVIVNAAECEPILNHNITRIEKNPAEIVDGLLIAMKTVHASKGILAIKAKHNEAIADLQKAIPADAPVSIALLEDIYPQGEERAIVRDVLGTLLPGNALPLEAGAVIVNAETCYRIFLAVRKKMPFIDKDLTCGGKLKADSYEDMAKVFLDTPLGISLGTVIERAGGMVPSVHLLLPGEKPDYENGWTAYSELIIGGPFTGHRASPDQPVVKTTGGILISECLPHLDKKMGLLVCACGADEVRMREIAEGMGATVVGIEKCKQAEDIKGHLKCANPGHCPGQVAKVMKLKREGAEVLLIGNCTDCTNTVMSCAPQLGLPVYHTTDCALRAAGYPLYRKMHADKS